MFRNLLKNNGFFLVPCLFIYVILAVVLLCYQKSDIHLWINAYHSAFFDWFFRNITFLGDGLFVFVPVVILLFFSLRPAIYILATYLSTGLLAQLIKRFLFADALRPSRYFPINSNLHLVDGVNMLSGHSFPSGHATTAFALYICLALISGNRWIKLAYFIVAWLVAFSRMYLSQHFLIDIFVGSLIGLAGAFAFYPVFYDRDRTWHSISMQKFFRHA